MFKSWYKVLKPAIKQHLLVTVLKNLLQLKIRSFHKGIYKTLPELAHFRLMVFVNNYIPTFIIVSRNYFTLMWKKFYCCIMMCSTYENSGLLGPVSSSQCFERTYWLDLRRSSRPRTHHTAKDLYPQKYQCLNLKWSLSFGLAKKIYEM